MANKWYQDKDGNTSSKRVAGMIILGCGLALLIATGIMALMYEIKDPATVLQVANTLMLTGGSLLGVGVVEGLGKGNK